MIKWTYKNGDDVRTEEGKTVFYTDQMSPLVIGNVVRMYNEGKTIKEIQKYLDKDELMCTLDEADYLIEEIENWLKINNGKESSIEVVPVQEEKWSVVVENIGVNKDLTKEDAISVYNDYIEQSKSGYGAAAGEDVTLMHGNEIVDEYIVPEPQGQNEEEIIDMSSKEPIQGDVLLPKVDADMKQVVDKVIEEKIAATEPEKEKEKDIIAEALQKQGLPQEKEKVTRRRVIAQSVIPKKQTPEDVIKELNEAKASIDAKIDLIRLFSDVKVPEMPLGLTKGNRDMMLSFHKEYEELIQKYLDIIAKG